MTSNQIRLTLPYPPSANRYWRTFRNRTVLSAEAKQYKKEVGWIVGTRGIEPLEGNVVVHLWVYRPRRSGDLDNRIKVALDSLNGIAYHDDKQIVEIHAYRLDDKEDPRVQVLIETKE